MEGDPNVGSSSSSAIKKRKKPSEVWEEMRKYTDRDGNVKAECIHCKKTFDGSSKKGTTHLKNHLERCPDNPKRRGTGGRDGDDRDISLLPSVKTKELASLIKENSVYDLVEHFSYKEGDNSEEEWEDWDQSSVLNSRKDEILQLYQEEKEKLCQFLCNLSCRFTLQLVNCLFYYFLVVYYIDDSWERQSKIISAWPCSDTYIQNLREGVKRSCLDWKIDRNICSLLFPFDVHPEENRDNQIGKMDSWFSQRRSLPFAGCLLDGDGLLDYLDDILRFKLEDGIRSLRECARYVDNKSRSDERIQLDGAVEKAISNLESGPCFSSSFQYLQAAVDVKEVFTALEQFDSNFRSINLSKQKWDEVTAAFEHLKFLKDIFEDFFWEKTDLPIIVDLPYVHKKLAERYNHPTEDCPFCEKVTKEAIDLFFGKHYLARVIAVILDPRFKADGLKLHYEEIYGNDADRYLEKVKKDFRGVYDEYAATDSSNSKSYEMLDAMGRPSSPKSELDLYMEELKVPAVEQFDLLAWWRGNAPFYPTLSRMARDYLAMEEFVAPAEGPLVDLMGDIMKVSHTFGFNSSELPGMIATLVRLKGFLSSAEN